MKSFCFLKFDARTESEESRRKAASVGPVSGSGPGRHPESMEKRQMHYAPTTFYQRIFDLIPGDSIIIAHTGFCSHIQIQCPVDIVVCSHVCSLLFDS